VVISGPWSDENAKAVDQTDNFVIETREVDTGIDFRSGGFGMWSA
jgi:hypothetical protein